MRFDVAIVGMGPVGAAMACLLAKGGLSVAVLDREPVMFDKPRAIVLDHEVLRTLQHCGVDQEFFSSISPHTGTDFVGVEGQLIKLFDPKAPPFELAWPPNVMFIQPELELALARAMEAQPGIIARRAVSVASLRETEAAVFLETKDAAGIEEVIEAAWVIGADGANSFVRSVAGLPLHDLDFAEWWIVVDAWLTGETKLPAKTTQYCQPSRPATFVVGPRGLLRWEIKLLPGEDPEAMRSDERIFGLLAQFVDIDAITLWRNAVYRFQAVVADKWRKGRLLIAGDAAHTMPPFLAQGLCAGLRDAANLSWRLIQVVRHGADPAILDDYERERRPHVAEIVAHAKEFGLIIGELDPERAAARDELLAEQLRSGTVSTERQAFIPPLRDGLIAADTPLAGTPFVQPRVKQAAGGEAVLMDDVIGPDFLIVATPAVIDDLGSDLADRWSAIGGRILAVGPEQPVGHGEWLGEVDGLVAGWLARSGVQAAIVRPDRYVYGTAGDAAALTGLAEDVIASLAPAHEALPA